MRDNFIKQLEILAENNPKILLITADLGFGVFNEYKKKFASQFLNVGVAEQNMTGVATGMALEGYNVFTYSIANFPTLRCLEQIRNDACYHNANVTIVSVGAGFSYGALGISHHATEDLAIMRSLPEITVVSPCGLWETMEATKAIAKHPGTCYFRLDKTYGDDSPKAGETFELGKARILREGADCSIIVTGGILEEVQNAVDKLAADGINSRIISMHTITPLDKDKIIQAAQETGNIITVEEHIVNGGLGGAVAEVLLESNTRPDKFLRIGLGRKFSSIVGTQSYLRKQYGLDSDSIYRKVKKLVCNKK
jgi:transketolase